MGRGLQYFILIRDIFIKSPRGGFEILDIFFTKLLTFLSYKEGAQKKIVDLSVRRMAQRSRSIFQNDPKLWTFLYGAWLRGPVI